MKKKLAQQREERLKLEREAQALKEKEKKGGLPKLYLFDQSSSIIFNCLYYRKLIFILLLVPVVTVITNIVTEEKV